MAAQAAVPLGAYAAASWERLHPPDGATLARLPAASPIEQLIHGRARSGSSPVKGDDGYGNARGRISPCLCDDVALRAPEDGPG